MTRGTLDFAARSGKPYAMSIITKLCALPGLYRGLDEKNLDPDPLRQFRRWYRFARRTGCYWPDSVSLATATPDGPYSCAEAAGPLGQLIDPKIPAPRSPSIGLS